MSWSQIPICWHAIEIIFYGLDRVVLLCLNHNIFFFGSKETNIKQMGATFVDPPSPFFMSKIADFPYFGFTYSKADLIWLFPYVPRITYFFLGEKRLILSEWEPTYVRYSMYMDRSPPQNFSLWCHAVKFFFAQFCLCFRNISSFLHSDAPLQCNLSICDFPVNSVFHGIKVH